MAQKQGPPYESCFFVRASAGRAIPVASDIKIISLCFIRHYFPSTKGDCLNCG